MPSLTRSVLAPGVDRGGLTERLHHPYLCLRAIYECYAFAKRGHDRTALVSIAHEALDRVMDPEEPSRFLAQDSSDSLWDAFCEISESHRHRPMEQLNRGVVAGLAELAQEIYRNDGRGSIVSWIVEGISTSSRVENQFMRLVDVRGVGPKVAAQLLRDVVFLFDLEGQIEFADRIYVQPIDKWIRAFAPYVAPELQDGVPPDWVLAGKISKHTRRVGVSGVRFNMGASFFGLREVREPEALAPKLALFVRSESASSSGRALSSNSGL